MERRYGPTGWWPGESPFEVAVGAILVQYTSWRNVEPAIENLKATGLLSAHAIVESADDALEAAIRPSGTYRLKAQRLRAFCTHLTSRYRGDIGRMARRPKDELREELLGIHGIGKETADDILLYACGHAVFVIDAYTRRIFGRHGHVPLGIKYDDFRSLFERNLELDVTLYREYHALIVHTGKDYCRRQPKCEGCPLAPTLLKGQPIDGH